MFNVVYLSPNDCPLSIGKIAVYSLEMCCAPKLLEIYSLSDLIKFDGKFYEKYIMNRITAISEKKFMMQIGETELFGEKNNCGLVFDIDQDGKLSFDFEFLQCIVYYADTVFKQRSLYIQPSDGATARIYDFMNKGKLIYEFKSDTMITEASFIGRNYIVVQRNCGSIDLYHIDDCRIITKMSSPAIKFLRTRGFSNSNRMLGLNDHHEYIIYSIPDFRIEYVSPHKYDDKRDSIMNLCFESDVVFIKGVSVEFMCYSKTILFFDIHDQKFKETMKNSSIDCLNEYGQKMRRSIVASYSCPICRRLNDTEDDMKQSEHNLNLPGLQHKDNCPTFVNVLLCALKDNDKHLFQRKDCITEASQLMKDLVDIVWEYDYSIPQTVFL